MPPRFSREITRPVVMGPKLKEQFRTSPCEAACPAGNSIQKMHALIEKGQFTEALRYLRAKNPFPGITGNPCRLIHHHSMPPVFPPISDDYSFTAASGQSMQLIQIARHILDYKAIAAKAMATNS